MAPTTKTFTAKFQDVLGGSHVLNNGNDIPWIGLGTAQNKDQAAMDATIHAALEAGYRLIDTAHIYENEHQIGEALEKSLGPLDLTREDLFITSKVPVINADPTGTVENCIKQSLKDLKTDYLDLVLVHFPKDRDHGKHEDFEGNKEARKKTWEKLEELHEKGIIRSIGVSNYEVYHLVELFEYAKIHPTVNQFEYHPYYTRPTLKHFCELKGIFVQAFSSLLWENKDIWEEVVLKQIAEKHKVSPQTILYAFPLYNKVGVIPKSATPSRIHDNLKLTLQVKLSPEDVSTLEKLDKNLCCCTPCDGWRAL